MYIKTFKTDVTDFISIKRNYVTSHRQQTFSSIRATKLILTISPGEIKGKSINADNTIEGLFFCL